MIVSHGNRWGFEMKFQDAPTMTKSMHQALNDLKLEHLWIIYPGATSYPLAKRVDCIAASALAQVVDRIR